MSSVKVNTPGLGFFSTIFLIFLTLKLCKVITWSWWLVFAPLYFPMLFLVGSLILIFVFAFLGIAVKHSIRRK